MALSRFAPPVTDSMEEQQRLTAIPEKTKSMAAWGIRVWNDWAATRVAVISETDRLIVTTPLLEIPVEDLVYWMGKFVLEARKTPLLEIPVEDLVYWMGKFVLEARKMDGSEYLPKTLYSLVLL